MTAETLLDVKNLSTHFRTRLGVIKAVDNVSFVLHEGETLGLVGESGCGKSVTALSIMRLVPSPPGRIVAGKIIFRGQDLLTMSEQEVRNVRGRDIGMIFQEPMTSLNPVLTIGRQLREPLELHLGMTKNQALRKSTELLQLVGMPDPETRLNSFPHQISGGQRQRVMIAMALSCEPTLLIADEATSALDVTIQAQILEIIKDLTDRIGTAVIIITHNLGVVARYADTVNVMYAGRIRETGSLDSVYKDPKHPYTVGLLNSVPTLDLDADARLEPIRGEIPNLADLPPGCAFVDRCDYAVQRCQEEDPELVEVGDLHYGACWEHERVARNLPGVTV
ncbi:MAG: ABC transporter ATP-binding protein [Chloroflexi bacterium]|nr:ABC transporter ATP-binding protein [Chloroflexota bacterium]MCH8115395.1 ABC transporter ATP-binding protein [Chloroflexota bacterium]MCI0775702.1 ABC transporter ATP-binding protein [Chloroflexota bacterium]MCI0804114.1 ABC transporter ATP-binding protein [Chloroflexota bacterium]MCI0809092.1 ABC transporter ATP-binding protein [Chloroflexota bacterium]